MQFKDARFAEDEHLRTKLLARGIMGLIFMALASDASAQIPRHWCTHATAQRLNVDVNGDGRIDAICHDRVTGVKWIAINRGGILIEEFVNTDIKWCSHRGSSLFAGDVNGDGRADLVCKDSGRIWIDYSGADFFRGTDFFVDTNWCTHRGTSFSVGDQNFDGRSDLVCTESSGAIYVDLADESGRFGGTDFFGTCRDGRSTPPFGVVADPTDRASATSSGELGVSMEATGAEDNSGETFVGVRGFSDAPNMKVRVSAQPTVENGRIRIVGAPFLGYGQAGASVALSIVDASGRVLCADRFQLNEQEAPGFNVSATLNRPRQLSCEAEVNGNFSTLVTLRGWASAGGAVTSSADARLKINSLNIRECRRG